MANPPCAHRVLAALLLGACCAACAGAPAPAASVRTGADPDGVPVQRYDTAERPDAVLGAQDAAAFASAIAGAGRDAGVALRGDGRLALLARRFAGKCRDGAQVHALADAARSLGMVDPAFELACARTSAPASLPPALAVELAERVRAMSATHFGVFVSGDRTAATAVLSRRPLALVPVPRRVDVGTPLRLRGRSHGVFAQPRIFVRGPDGERSWPAGAGPDFDMQVPTPHAGCYRVELLARSGDRVHTLAELAAYAGDAASPDSCVTGTRSAVTRAQLAALQRGLFRRIARLRAASGLRALAIDAQLDHAAKQAGENTVRATAQPASEDTPAARVLLARARGDDEDALFRALAGDVAQRAKLLDPAVTHLGLAVHADADSLIATVLLARLADAADLELAPARLLDTINRNRAVRGAPALRPDATLTRIARRSADAFFAVPARSEREIVAGANAELERFGLSYRRVAALAMLVDDPLDAAALEPALEAGAGAVGIAVAQGVRAGTGARTLAVVIALGWDR